MWYKNFTKKIHNVVCRNWMMVGESQLYYVEVFYVLEPCHIKVSGRGEKEPKSVYNVDVCIICVVMLR